MFPGRLKWAPGLLALMMVAGSGAGLFAGDKASDEALAKLGLKQSGAVVVLEAESDVHNKVTEARQLYREWSNAVMRQRSTVSEKEYQSTIKELTNESNQLRNQVNTTNQMINSLPRYRGRFATNYAAEQNAELTVYRTQLQWEINQRNTFLSQLKSQPFDPKAKLKVDAEVRDKNEALHQVVLDLRKLVDETDEKFKGLGKNEEVKKLLTTMERKTHTKVQLVQSRLYHLDLKYLEKLEQQVSPGESSSSTEKSAKKTRRTKGKRTYRQQPDDTDSPF